MPSRPKQTMPSLTLRYEIDEATGAPVWQVVVSDGEHQAEPVTVSVETAVGISQVFDAALPDAVDVEGEATTAERVVRAAHVQTLEAQLQAARAYLRAAAPAPTPATNPSDEGEQVAKPEPKARSRRKATRSRPPAAQPEPPQGGQTPSTDAGDPVRSETGPGPELAAVDALPENVPDGQVPIPDEPPSHSPAGPGGPFDHERLPRRPHLAVPDVEEF